MDITEPGYDASPQDAFEALKARADALERKLEEVEQHAQSRLRQSELKAEAVRAGIVDLDGLRLIESKDVAGRDTSMESPAAIIDKLRRAKPWLFGAPNSSSVASAPSAVPTKRRLATEMTVEEWRTARADLLQRR